VHSIRFTSVLAPILCALRAMIYFYFKRAIALALFAILSQPSPAQSVLVLAGANDNPNALINGFFDGAQLSFRPTVASGGASTGQVNYFEFAQVRVHPSAQPGCTLIAQTNGLSGNVSIYRLDEKLAITPVPNSPFATGTDTESLAWAPDGGALYVPLGKINQLITFRVQCNAGVVSVQNAGSVTLSGVSSQADVWVSGVSASGHLCVAGRGSNTAACYAIDAKTRLPSIQPVNVVSVGGARGVKIARNGCGVFAVGNANLVQGFRVDATGLISLTNTAPTTDAARYGAITSDGTMAAIGSAGQDFSVYSINASCALSLIGSDTNSGSPFVEYMAFDKRKRLYVADGLRNRIRIFTPSLTGIGPAIISVITNHPTTNPVSGIDVYDVPVPGILLQDGFE
jgi:Lactonase, 7-bladed beta-propeller